MNFNVRSLATKLGLGRLAYRLVFAPTNLLKQSIREGGPWAQAEVRAGHKAMKIAATQLPRLKRRPTGPFAEISYLSGTKYWHQTVFCFVSLQMHVPFCITPVIYDDGTMDQHIQDQIRRVVPWVKFVVGDETESRLDMLLPECRFPSLRGRRRIYPHLRKLLDIHAGSLEYRLVADSDMLFFREPTELMQWFTKPHWLYIHDIITAYGYPKDFLTELAGAPLPLALNAGLYAIDGASIDWDEVERWCEKQLFEYGPQYVQEQALTAMLFANKNSVALPQESYVVMPGSIEGKARSAVMHHYVDVSKRFYLRKNWKQIEQLAMGQ